MRQLRAIMRVKLRSKPDLLAEWESASRVDRPAKQPTTTTPSLAGSGSGTTTTAAITGVAITLTQGGFHA